MKCQIKDLKKQRTLFNKKRQISILSTVPDSQPPVFARRVPLASAESTATAGSPEAASVYKRQQVFKTVNRDLCSTLLSGST